MPPVSACAGTYTAANRNQAWKSLGANIFQKAPSNFKENGTKEKTPLSG